MGILLFWAGWVMAVTGFQGSVSFEKSLGFPPWGTRTRATASGRRERGLLLTFPCRQAGEGTTRDGVEDRRKQEVQ